MSKAVKVSDQLIFKARLYAKTFHRSTAGQIEYWAKIGQLTEENPDLSYHLIKNILLGMQELQAGDVEPYIFDEGKS